MGRITGVLIALALGLLLPTTAQAAYPGENGKIAISYADCLGCNGKIDLMSPDGSGRVQITPSSSSNVAPVWSPDGEQIAFLSYRDTGSGHYPDIYVMNGDGSNVRRLTNNAIYDSIPSWSPDASKLIYELEAPETFLSKLYIINSDGTGETEFVPSFPGKPAPSEVTEPDWSPDGKKISFKAIWYPDTLSSNGYYWADANTGVVGGRLGELYWDRWDWKPDATALTYEWRDSPGGQEELAVTGRNPPGLGTPGERPVWSPDGTKILATDGNLFTINPDGTNKQYIPGAPSGTASWQPILKGYPRPKGAGTLHAPLVPAYQPCVSPNRVHAAPLSYSSCNPPTRFSTQLTIGTPDSNGKAASSVASLRIGVIPGNPGTPADEAEANLITSITDVRNASDLSDYTGNLEMRVPLQITDKSNTPYPGGPGPGTVAWFTFTWNVPCTATADSNTGSSCSLATTADTLLPGSVLETRRAIWETDRIEVRDGSGQPFLRQGIFVP